MMRQPFVGGNWKMNGSLAKLERLTQQMVEELTAFSQAEVVLFPSFVYLPAIQALLKNSALQLGAQNVSQYSQGAHTGETAAVMLNEMACRYVMVGHSERRMNNKESDACIAEKFFMAQQHGLRPVLCLGENLAEREAGQTTEVVCRQLEAVLARVGVVAFAEAVLAYEPIWAIGTGKSAKAEEVQAVHQTLRYYLADYDETIAKGLRIIYGGSLKAETAPAIVAMSDVDGGLIGGASLQAASFVAICQAIGHNSPPVT